MIVVGFLGAAGGGRGDALAEGIAARSAALGARVEMAGLTPPTPDGDATLLRLAAAGVRHATMVRSNAGGLEPADADLALRYLPDVRAIVLVAPDEGLLPTVAAAADWSVAGLVIVGGVPGSSALPASTLVLDPPAADPDGTFAGFVAALAVRLDAGEEPNAAFKATVANLAADRV